jgi:drug/metabolite transporter (DMT)-like permease
VFERNSYATGIALAIVGAVFFSGKAIVVKLAYRYGVDPITLIALRMAFALPFFAAAYAWTSRGARRLSGREHAQLILLGLLGYYAASYFDFMGLQYVTAALGRLILFLNPTIVLLISALALGKRFAPRDFVALALAYGGIVLVYFHEVRLDSDGLLLGSAFVFASAVCYAIYLVVSGELVRRIGAIRLTAYAMCVSTAAIFVHFAIANPIDALLQPEPVYGLSLINAVFCTVLPVFATMLAIERIGAGRTSLAAMIGPVTTIALAYLLLGEPVSHWQIAGTLLVLCGIYVLSRSAPDRIAAAPDPSTKEAI